MMFHILNNLPEEYETIVDWITKELSNKTLTLESLQEDSQEKFERMKSKKSGKGETAFYSKQIRTRCHGCRKIGHRKEDCWELDANKDKRSIIGIRITKRLGEMKIQTRQILYVRSATRKDIFRQIVQTIWNKNQGLK
jgi:hypothetical protein